MQSINNLDGRVALITGAGRGIGAACAIALANAGATVIVTDRNTDDGDRTVTGINADGGAASFFELDVADEKAWTDVMDIVRSRYAGLDILVNNAGVASGAKPLDQLPLEQWRKLLSINLDGVFLGMKHAIPLLSERAERWHGGASIVSVSSVMGFVGGSLAAAYCASKGGVRLLTKAAAIELAPRKIRVNSVHPGFIDTPLLRSGVSRMEQHKPGNGQLFVDNTVKRHPLGRLGAAEDIANGVVYLASDQSAFVTGTELVIDGGYLAQ